MTDTLIKSLILTLVGMIVVFAFMGFMILFVKAFIALARRFWPDREEADDAEAEPLQATVAADSAGTEGEVVAAIASALKLRGEAMPK